MKELKTKARQLPIEEVKLSAMKYDQLQKQKEDFMKTKDEIVIPKTKEEIPIPKTKDKKKRIIKKIIYEDGSEDEIDDMRYTQPSALASPSKTSARVSIIGNCRTIV